jgi:hypothetical protein
MKSTPSLPNSILTIFEIAKDPCSFCESGGECEAQLCRKSVEEICEGRPVSITQYPTFSPLQTDAFAYCDSYRQVLESEPKQRSADTFFFPAFLRLAKSEGGKRFQNIDVDLVLKAICCIRNDGFESDFRDYAEILLNSEYQDFAQYLVHWSRESQKSEYHNAEEGYRTDLLLNMAVMLDNIIKLAGMAAGKIKAALAGVVDFSQDDLATA